MEKTFTPSSWEMGDQIVQLVKVASGGRLIGKDYNILVKRAGEEFAWRVKNELDIDPGHVPVHILAMGATEGYGSNRNGDGFKEASLIDYHPTFVKYARHYRHHKNKDPSKSYGQVKASCYNKAMRRVELLNTLFATKEAAEKGGGFVADKEMDMLESGKDIPVSMACKIAYDVCSGCGNKAKNRSEYCDATTCKYGGCKHNLTKVAEDGHVLHVDNPHPSFFDMSTVIRGADRNAFGVGADYFSKAASAEVIGGAQWAEIYGVIAPLEIALEKVSNPRIANQIKLAYLLADREDIVQETSLSELNRAFSSELQPEADLSPLGKVGSTKCATGLAALASQKISLPVRDFLRLALDGDSEKTAAVVDSVTQALPGIYNRLISSGTLESAIQSNPFTPSQKLASASQRQWAIGMAEKYSLDVDHVRQRVARSAIREITRPSLLQSAGTKSAAESSEVESLARRYALYKLAMLASQERDVPLTYDLAVRQNYLI